MCEREMINLWCVQVEDKERWGNEEYERRSFKRENGEKERETERERERKRERKKGPSLP